MGRSRVQERAMKGIEIHWNEVGIDRKLQEEIIGNVESRLVEKREFREVEKSLIESFEFLKENDLGYCAVDEPKLPRLMPFVNEVTTNIGYLRFHGRNTNWFNASTSERYNCLYSDDELKEFIPETDKIGANSEKACLFFNNCHEGKADRNAQTLKNKLSQ